MAWGPYSLPTSTYFVIPLLNPRTTVLFPEHPLSYCNICTHRLSDTFCIKYMYWANMVLYLPHLYSPMNIKCWHCWKQDTEPDVLCWPHIPGCSHASCGSNQIMNLLSLPLSCLYTVISSTSMGTHRSGNWEYSAQCMPSALELPQQNFKTICDSGYHMPDQMSIDLFHSDCSSHCSSTASVQGTEDRVFPGISVALPIPINLHLIWGLNY